ncbi:hypothetical protein [Gottfriedia acidiceleris]
MEQYSYEEFLDDLSIGIERLWRKANKDKVSEYNKAYWNKKASELE